MRIAWHFAQNDIDAVRSIVADHRNHVIVRDRIARNLSASKPAVDRQRFWRALTMALLTTQQPSGPRSAVTRFLAGKPYELTYRRCTEISDVAAYVTDRLTTFGGIRRHGVIGSELSRNLALLDDGLWPELLERLASLRAPTTINHERSVADFLHEKMFGLGPKQSRNLLLALGLVRYEIPLDSRVGKWLRGIGFPVPVNPAALADRDYYCFALDGLQLLCAKADEYPCVVDGAVFASFDSEEWRDDLIQF